MSSNDLFNINEDSEDDNEDDDYKPENEVLSDNSGSESQEEEDISDGHKQKSNKNQKNGKQEEEDKQNARNDHKLSADQLKQKSDSLWEEFSKDLSKTDNSIESEKVSTESSDCFVKTMVTKTYDFAGEQVLITEEVANTSKATLEDNKTIDDKSNDNPKEIAFKGVKRSGGLGNVLNQLKKPKINTLQKSFIDWKNFKKTEGIEDELNQHNRSKDTFVERQAFLQRTDLRQFEIEKQIREKNRSQRQLSKD